jgi:hypothetical protein
MSYTRRRNLNQTAGKLPFVDNIHTFFNTSINDSESRIMKITMNVNTTRSELQRELAIVEKKMTTLETEFNKYQKLATKVMAALDVLDKTKEKLDPEQSGSDEMELDSSS